MSGVKGGQSGQLPEVVSFGEPLAALYPTPFEEVDARESDNTPSVGGLPTHYQLTWGGDTSNFSIAMAKLGHSCAYLTRVGDDVFGRGFLEVWESNGVETSGVQIDRRHRTGLYFATFDKGRHELVYFRAGSAATQTDPAEMAWSMVEGARALHLSGISQAISSEMTELSFNLMARAKRHGAMISYDVNYRPALWESAKARAVALETISEYVDVLEITDEEMLLLGLGESPEDLMSRLPRVPRYCAVKRGAQGSFLWSRDGSCSVASFRVPVKDTVGAGDAYDAALVAAILEKMSLEEAGRFASAAGALTCTGTGPLNRQPRREEIEALLGEPEPPTP